MLELRGFWLEGSGEGNVCGCVCVCVGGGIWGLTPQQQPGSYQGGEMWGGGCTSNTT